MCVIWKFGMASMINEQKSWISWEHRASGPPRWLNLHENWMGSGVDDWSILAMAIHYMRSYEARCSINCRCKWVRNREINWDILRLDEVSSLSVGIWWCNPLTPTFFLEFHLTNIRGNDWILFGSSNLDLIGLHGSLGISKGKIPWNTGYKRWLIISNSGRLYQKRNAAGYWGFGTCPKFHITGAQEGI
jgi:hypothetical protein